MRCEVHTKVLRIPSPRRCAIAPAGVESTASAVDSNEKRFTSLCERLGHRSWSLAGLSGKKPRWRCRPRGAVIEKRRVIAEVRRRPDSNRVQLLRSTRKEKRLFLTTCHSYRSAIRGPSWLSQRSLKLDHECESRTGPWSQKVFARFNQAVSCFERVLVVIAFPDHCWYTMSSPATSLTTNHCPCDFNFLLSAEPRVHENMYSWLSWEWLCHWVKLSTFREGPWLWGCLLKCLAVALPRPHQVFSSSTLKWGRK